MMQVFKRAWAGVMRPILQRPKRVQVAALCYRGTGAEKEVLLITSRDTGRWIVPKGWPMDGYDGPGTALQEAWEEAGVKSADIQTDPIGQYEYAKNLGEGMTVQVETQVYLTRVDDLSAEYPEASERKRQWFQPKEAANLVAEPELQEILRAV